MLSYRPLSLSELTLTFRSFVRAVCCNWFIILAALLVCCACAVELDENNQVSQDVCPHRNKNGSVNGEEAVGREWFLIFNLLDETLDCRDMAWTATYHHVPWNIGKICGMEFDQRFWIIFMRGRGEIFEMEFYSKFWLTYAYEGEDCCHIW